jgi:hypothetical protein
MMEDLFILIVTAWLIRWAWWLPAVRCTYRLLWMLWQQRRD